MVHFPINILNNINKHYLVTARADGFVTIFDLFKGIAVASYKAHDKDILCITRLSFKKFVTGSMDFKFKIWDILD